MTAALAWAAFVLSLLELVFVAAVAIVVRRFYLQVRPQVSPLLALVGPYSTSSSGGEPALRADDPHRADG